MALTPNQKHLLHLIAKDEDEEGWTNVSEMLWKFVSETVKGLEELVELRRSGQNGGGQGRITPIGKSVMKYI